MVEISRIRNERDYEDASNRIDELFSLARQGIDSSPSNRAP